MKHTNPVKLACLAVVLLLLIGSCKKETRTTWDTDMLVPIANTSLSLQNIVKDSSIKANSDNSLTLAYSSSLYGFSLADQIVSIPDTAIGQKFGLNDLVLPSQQIAFTTSLGTMAKNMVATADPSSVFLGNFILTQHGTNQTIPPFSGISPGAFHFDASAYFDSATLISGEVQLWVNNHLPIPIDQATITLKNTSSGATVTSYDIYNVKAYDSAYFVIPIGGARITNQLDFVITNLRTAGSPNPVLIDTNDFFQIRVYVTALRASEAWARFPTQNVVDITGEITTEIADRQLTYIDARQGNLRVYVTSSVQEQMFLQYTLVGAFDKFGKPLSVSTRVPPAPPGGTIQIDTLLDVTGFAINLTGVDGSKFNTYTQKILARIDSSGQTRHVTNSDSVVVRYELINIAPNYIKGYAGRDTIHTVDSADFAFLNTFKSGSLQLEDVKMNFTVENGIGVDGQIKINSLRAYSPLNGSRNLTGSILGQQLTVQRGTDFPLTPAINNYVIDNNNSNMKDLLGLLPSKLYYDVEVKTNVNGNTRQYRDFAYLESQLKVKLNAEIPLSLIANQLTLKDTLNFNLSETNTNVEGINDGILNVIIQNKYPIESVLNMVVYDEFWNPVDTLLLNQRVEPATVAANCRVENGVRTKIPLYIDEDRMEKIKLGRQAIITAEFSTTGTPTCNNNYVKIYSDYKLEVTLSARFNYKISMRF